MDPTDYLPLVRMIAARIRTTTTTDRDDLVQAGWFGLARAAQLYDPAQGVKFESFAKFHIRGAMLDELRLMDWMPTKLRREERRRKKAGEEARFRPEIYPVEDEKGNQYPDVDSEAHAALMYRDVCDAAFRGLQARDREWAELYYVERKTMREIGERYGCSESLVCQRFTSTIYNSVSRRLRAYMEGRA